MRSPSTTRRGKIADPSLVHSPIPSQHFLGDCPQITSHSPVSQTSCRFQELLVPDTSPRLGCISSAAVHTYRPSPLRVLEQTWPISVPPDSYCFILHTASLQRGISNVCRLHTCTGGPAAATLAGRADDLVPMSCRLKLSPCSRLLADAAPEKKKSKE